MEKFKEYNLKLDEKNISFIQEYLQRLKNIVDKYNIESELYNDIEDMIFEKLSNEKNLDQLKIKKILKDVWEPEIIFSEYINSSTNSKEEHKKEKIKSKQEETPIYEKLIQNWWIRQKEDMLLLWVSPLLWKKSSLPIWIVNCLFIIFIFVWGISIPVYLILWWILPKEWVDYNNMTTLKYLMVQLRISIKDFFVNIVKSLRKFLSFIIKKIIYLFKNIMKFITPTIRFIIFMTISIMLFFMFIWLLFLWAAYIWSPVIWNIDFSMVIPSYFIAWILLWIYSILVLLITAFLYSFSWKTINKSIIISSLITFIIALFLAFSTIFNLVSTYSNFKLVQNETIISLEDKSQNIVLNIENILFENNIYKLLNVQWNTPITLKTNEENNIKITLNTEILWNDFIEEKYREAFKNIITKNEKNNVIKLEYDKNSKIKIPPFLFKRHIEIFIPEWYNLSFDNFNYYDFYITNAHISTKYNKYENYLRSNCEWDKIISYSKDEERFICEPNSSELESARKEYIRYYIINNFDSISTIQHQDEYKRDYYNGQWVYSDWNFSNFYWKNDNELNIEFSDMSLDIRASVNVIENQDEIIINDFKINYVNIEDYVFKDKYYKNIDSIRSFLWDNYKNIWEDNNTENTQDYYDED